MSSSNIPEDKRLLELQRFELLVSAIHDYAIYMLDVDGYVVNWNAGAQRFKGYTTNEIVGQHFSRFYTPEDQATGLPSQALKTAAAEGSFQAEGWRVRKDGTRFWANVIVDPIVGADGRLLGFAKITRDIGDRKAAEEALRRSEQQFRLLVQGVTDYAIYMLDPSGLITNWNAGAQRIKGYTEAEALGTHFSRFYTTEDRAAGVPQTALSIAKDEGRFEREGWRVRKDGSRFRAHVVIDALHDTEGTFIGFAKITRDITEQHAAAEALKRTEKALVQSQKMETIGKLTGGVAHDFNNLLQVIAGNLQLLSRDIVGNERAERRLNNALAGVSRGAKLASHLLAFGRRQALEPKVANLGRLIFTMEDMLQRALGETVEVQTSVGHDVWNCLVDLGQVENALLNLAINARDAMDGAGKLTIEVANAHLDEAYSLAHVEVEAGQYVMVAVSDTGAGMSPEVIAQAFDPFFSTKPEGKGTGLGLSMVYGFVKQSGGHVKIYSEVGEGTTIKLYLPRSQQPEDLIADVDQRPAVGGSETILVAEDDEQVRITVVETLRELGYQVLVASDAEAALAVVQSGMKIDMLFTDVVMPGRLSTPDLARKARERLPGLAVLFTSGYTRNAIVHGGRLDAGVELLSKPYSREDLARRIRHAFANQSQRGVMPSAPAQNASVTASLSGPRLRILLVEDDEVIRATTAEILQDLGHAVTQALGGAQALAILDAGDVDLMIVDIGLPDISGTEVAEAARAKHPTLGVVFATGQNIAITMDRACVLVKPYDRQAIIDALRFSL
ncbi:PAS domain S-box-containing protein [Variovorax boronicumulans]|uniref:hybrid sensor histidine kinase/response regulator n=1 Tax=Variovorax boronicumulans TaxID=436515 RepID=UPI002473D57B|nr:PAS domain S-box protein [Variovorax boronicumulans]MDH6170052.1 PAS domain S-box-containing protein [Variovorax boronicumulans]